jgi:SulP family sulfate permease
MVLASLLFMRRMAEVTQVRLTTETRSDLPGTLPSHVALYEISGPLFFGAAQKAMARLHVIGDQARVVILAMEEVYTMDATGLVALESALSELKRHKCLAILAHVQVQPLELLRKAGVHERAGVLFCASVAQALAASSAYVADPSQRPSAKPAPAAD